MFIQALLQRVLPRSSTCLALTMQFLPLLLVGSAVCKVSTLAASLASAYPPSHAAQGNLTRDALYSLRSRSQPDCQALQLNRHFMRSTSLVMMNLLLRRNSAGMHFSCKPRYGKRSSLSDLLGNCSAVLVTALWSAAQLAR